MAFIVLLEMRRGKHGGELGRGERGNDNGGWSEVADSDGGDDDSEGTTVFMLSLINLIVLVLIGAIVSLSNLIIIPSPPNNRPRWIPRPVDLILVLLQPDQPPTTATHCQTRNQHADNNPHNSTLPREI